MQPPDVLEEIWTGFWLRNQRLLTYMRTPKELHTDFCFVCGCSLCRELRTGFDQVDAPCCCSRLPGEYPPWNFWGRIVLVAFGVWDPWDKSFHPVALKIGAGLFSLAWWRGRQDFLGFASLIRRLTQPLTVFLSLVTVLPGFRKYRGNSSVTLHPVQILFRRFLPSSKITALLARQWEAFIRGYLPVGVMPVSSLYAPLTLLSILHGMPKSQEFCLCGPLVFFTNGRWCFVRVPGPSWDERLPLSNDVF